MVIKRVDLAALHIEFLEKAEALNKLFEEMECMLHEKLEQDNLKRLENNWNDIKNSYGNLKACGMRILNMKVCNFQELIISVSVI